MVTTNEVYKLLTEDPQFAKDFNTLKSYPTSHLFADAAGDTALDAIIYDESDALTFIDHCLAMLDEVNWITPEIVAKIVISNLFGLVLGEKLASKLPVFNKNHFDITFEDGTKDTATINRIVMGAENALAIIAEADSTKKEVLLFVYFNIEPTPAELNSVLSQYMNRNCIIYAVDSTHVPYKDINIPNIEIKYKDFSFNLFKDLAIKAFSKIRR